MKNIGILIDGLWRQIFKKSKKNCNYLSYNEENIIISSGILY